MSASVAPAVTLVWAIRRGLVETWRELPHVVVAGLLGSLAIAPLAVAALAAAPGWMLALTVLPAALGATVLAGFAGRVRRAEGLTRAAYTGVDPVLALLLAAATIVAGVLLTTPGTMQLAGAVLAALVLVVALPALAYGAVRGRRGLAALRGGIILALLRPGWTLTLAAFVVLAAFAVVASAGVLAVVAGPFLLGVAVSMTDVLLDEIDHLQGGAS